MTVRRYREVQWLLQGVGYAGTRRLLFRVTTVDGATLCMKFTQRYSQAVHAAWAVRDAGLAPVLHSVESLPGGWHIVTMELLRGDSDCMADLQMAGQSTRQARVHPA